MIKTYDYPGEVHGSQILIVSETQTATAYALKHVYCITVAMAMALQAVLCIIHPRGQLGRQLRVERVRRTGKRCGRAADAAYCPKPAFFVPRWVCGFGIRSLTSVNSAFLCSVQHIQTSSQELDSPAIFPSPLLWNIVHPN